MLVNARKACVVVFNMQLEIVPLLESGTQLLNDCCWMIDVAGTLGLPRIVVEQKKLGASSQALKAVAGDTPYLEKTYFDFTRHEDIASVLEATGCEQFVLAGAESHVCVLQSAAGLRARGKDVFVVSDAISARNTVDHAQALRRLPEIGARLITKEMFFFESIGHSEYPNYIEIAMKYLDGRYIR
jgi:isochorismate hydrolase